MAKSYHKKVGTDSGSRRSHNEPGTNAVPLREEFAALARRKAGNGNPMVLALVLAQMEYWQLHKERDAFVVEEVGRAANGGRGSTERGWIYKSASQLCDELYNVTSQSTVDRALDKLHALGILRRRHNPHRRNDRTLQYRLDLLVLGSMLKEQGHRLEKWPEVEAILRAGAGDEEPAENCVSGAAPANPAICHRDGAGPNSYFDPVSIRHGDESIRQGDECICHGDESIRHGDETIPEITTRDYIQRTRSKNTPLNPPVPGGPSNIPSRITDRSDEVSRPARSAALRPLGGSLDSKRINVPHPDDPDLPASDDTADPPHADIIPFVPAGRAAEPDAKELTARLRTLPAGEMLEYARTHARRIEELSRLALPANGGGRETKTWIPQAPVHELFARLGLFPGNRPSLPVSRSFMRVFRNRQITTASLVILARNPDAFERTELAEAGDVTRWFGMLRHGSRSDEGRRTLGQEVAWARRQVASMCLRMDPDGFGAPLTDAGFDVQAELARINDGHLCGVRAHWQGKMLELQNADDIPAFDECHLSCDTFIASRFMKNCAIERAHRLNEQMAASLGGVPRPRSVLTIDNPDERALVVGALAADHNLRHDVFHLLGNDVFGITRDEIEEEVGRRREEAREGLEFYFGDMLEADTCLEDLGDMDDGSTELDHDRPLEATGTA